MKIRILNGMPEDTERVPDCSRAANSRAAFSVQGLLVISFAVVLLVCAASLVARGRFCPTDMAFNRPVGDGTIVLLRKGNTIGAFVLENQNYDPELTDYKWYLRTDGKTTIDPKDPAVSTGAVHGASSIKFGPFNVDWSTLSSG